jgi:lysophospholipase L1-like esterase
LDFKAYLEKYHQGRVPDVIVILLGCNDIAHACNEDFERWMAASRAHRKQLLDHIRENAPGSIIGLVTLPPANLRNKAYIENYHGNVVLQQFVYNQNAYVKQLLLDYQDDPEYSIVPIYQVVDGMADFPVDNAIHPAPSGYSNFAAAIENWLKSLFA